jgi:hypothetical protein
MLCSKYFVLSSDYLKCARPASSFDLLIVAAISHPLIAISDAKARSSFHIPFKSDGPRKLCISFRGGKGYGLD